MNDWGLLGIIIFCIIMMGVCINEMIFAAREYKRNLKRIARRHEQFEKEIKEFYVRNAIQKYKD